MEWPIEKHTTSACSPFTACRSALAAEEASLEKPAAGPSPALGKSILVVDDQQSIRDILFHLLTGMGFRVVTAGDGAEGWKRFQSTPCDLVLTDLHMPGMDGWGLARRIKAGSPGTPVVLLTGEGRGRVLEKLDHSGVDTALFKPFTLSDLEETVLRILKEASNRQV